MRRSLMVLAACVLLATPAAAADKLKIGFLTTLSGPGAIVGTELKNGFDLGMEHVGGKPGGVETEVLVGDDQLKVDVGREIVDKWLKSDRVDIIAGHVWSNILLATYPMMTKAGVFILDSNAGPSQIAGADCNENFFSTSWANDNAHEAMGKYLTDQKIPNVYLMTLNYQAGRDKMEGFKRYYKGKIAGEVYTKLDQLDFAPELANIRAANPAAVYVFYPGGQGIQFVKQYVQSGLMGKIPLYSAETIDDSTIGAIGDIVQGVKTVSFWTQDAPNAQNKRFVADYIKKYGHGPAPYAAQAYDSVMLLDSALRAVHGNFKDQNALRAALKKADFHSVRGKFRYNNNHFPIQDWFLVEAGKSPEGRPMMKRVSLMEADHQDAYHQLCPMK